MTAYLVTTAAVFVLLAVAHVVRVVQEPHLVRDPWFLLVTAIALSLAVWALTLLRRVRVSRPVSRQSE